MLLSLATARSAAHGGRWHSFEASNAADAVLVEANASEARRNANLEPCCLSMKSLQSARRGKPRLLIAATMKYKATIPQAKAAP